MVQGALSCRCAVLLPYCARDGPYRWDTSPAVLTSHLRETSLCIGCSWTSEEHEVYTRGDGVYWCGECFGSEGHKAVRDAPEGGVG